MANNNIADAKSYHQALYNASVSGYSEKIVLMAAMATFYGYELSYNKPIWIAYDRLNDFVSEALAEIKMRVEQ